MEILTNFRCTNIVPVHRNPGAGIEVYSAKHPHFGDVTVKVLECSSEATLRCSQKEGRIAQTIEHPSVCRVFEQAFAQTGSGFKYYIITEKPASDLSHEIKKRMQRQTPWSEESVLNMLEQAVSALAHAQNEGVCHRDIKPQSILIWQDGRIKLADFSSANEEIHNSEVQILTLQGTFLYSSPELREFFVLPDHERPQKARYNPYKCDVYSLALTCIHLLQLFPAMDMTKLEGLPEATKRRVDDLPVSSTMKEILMSMLSSEESSRPDFSMLKEILDDVLNEGRDKQFVEPLPDNYLFAPGEEIQARQGHLIPALPGMIASPRSSDVLSPPNMIFPIAPSNFGEQPQAPVKSTLDESLPSYKPAKPNPVGAGHVSDLLQGSGSSQSEQASIQVSFSMHSSYHRPSEPPEPEVGQEPPELQEQCVICQKILDSTAMELECGHRFCAIDCLEVLMLTRLQYFRLGFQELLCPVESCRLLISREYIQNLKFAGMTIRTYTRVRQTEEKCTECKRAKKLRTMECSHKFCANCMAGWVEIASCNHTRLKCSICREPLADQDAEYIARIVNIPENLR